MRSRRCSGEEGYGLTVAARRPEKLEAAAEGLAAKGYDVQQIAGNLGDEETIASVVAAHEERFGRCDVLINNAGVGIGEVVDELTTKKVDIQLNTNLRSIFLFYRQAMPMLRRAGEEHRNALVVNTASISGIRGEGWLSIYSATKHGVVGFTQAMNKELGGAGIKNTALCPGVRRHADDRVHQGARGGGDDDHDRPTSPSRCATCSGPRPAA